MTKRVLILGADGFIGRHLAYALRRAGYEVTACARNTRRLKAMGFATLTADLTAAQTHDPAFWAPHLRKGCHLVNAAGLLNAAANIFEAVHCKAPKAAMAALDGGHALLISAVGLEANTDFAKHRRKAEVIAAKAGATILRPGLVLADTSYGGSSLLRALAALPWVSVVVGSGDQPFNPIHAADLAEVVTACLINPPGPGPLLNGAWEVGGPETLSQSDLIQTMRRWLGLLPARLLHLPIGLARSLGRIGDLLRLGPLSATSVAQLQSGIQSDPSALLAKIPTRPRAATEFIAARPAGTQDLWQARLYLIKPLIRLVFALLWLTSGLLGLLLPAASFLPIFNGIPLSDAALTALARTGGVVDLALAFALLRNWRPHLTGVAQLVVVLGYTVGLSLIAPGLWLAPLGELLKNLPILALALVHIALIEER